MWPDPWDFIFVRGAPEEINMGTGSRNFSFLNDRNTHKFVIVLDLQPAQIPRQEF